MPSRNTPPPSPTPTHTPVRWQATARTGRDGGPDHVADAAPRLLAAHARPCRPQRELCCALGTWRRVQPGAHLSPPSRSPRQTHTHTHTHQQQHSHELRWGLPHISHARTHPVHAGNTGSSCGWISHTLAPTLCMQAGPARWRWQHGIFLDGDEPPETCRVSMVFRLLEEHPD